MSEDSIAAKGSCLCGKVTYQASLKPGLGACHCAMCRQWSAGPFMSAHAIGAVKFIGDDNIGVYNSSAWAERGFCKHCGSNLYYRLLPRPGLPEGELILSAGTINDQSGFKFDHEVFVDHAPGWYQFHDNNSRRRMTEAELLVLFESSE